MTVDTTALHEVVAQPRQGKGKTIRQVVEEQLPQIGRALPKMMSADRFTRLLLTELSRTPKLAECSAQSLLGSVMYAAQLGLEPGPLGHVYLIPYKGKCTLVIGYRGLIELARRSEKIVTLEAREVCENDDFEFSVGDDAHVRHSWDIRKERGAVVAYYGLATFTNGGKYILPMSLADIAKRRARSMAKDSGPWNTDPEAMSLKTTIRAMQRFLPLTPEIATAFQQDEIQVEFDPDRPTDEALEVADYEPLEVGGADVGAGDAADGEVDQASPAPADEDVYGGPFEPPSEQDPDAERDFLDTTSPRVAGTVIKDNVIEPTDNGIHVDPGDDYDTLSDEELTKLCRTARPLPLSISGSKAHKIARLRSNDRALEEPM